MIIGTAGHIDHGKTALVRALTGVGTDRLPEEKRRGITIELGFAPLELDGVGSTGVVDVPGHEAFVRTMVAGAAGIDVALLVVAADEGVMPQTREHVAILDLLGTERAVVAITKRDLVDAEWVALVRSDVEALLQPTRLAGAPLIETSVRTGEGIEALRKALADRARDAGTRDATEVFRMPIDRAFSVRGTGTVVTGTVWSGTVRPDTSVTIQPGGREARVRGLQAHGHATDVAGAATRAAVALAGVDVDDAPRGAWLVGDASWPTTRSMRAEVVLLRDANLTALSPREWVRLHVGTADVGARVVGEGGALTPGSRRPARIVLQQPILARAGDRFVLRRASPPETIGGGTVIDPLPMHRRWRRWPEPLPDRAGRLRLMAHDAGSFGLDARLLPLRLGVPSPQAKRMVQDDATLVTLGDSVFDNAFVAQVRDDVLARVDEFHRSRPIEPGIQIASLKAQLLASSDLSGHVINSLLRSGDIVATGSIIALRGFTPSLNEPQQGVREAVLAALRAAGAEPPNVSSLASKYHSDVMPLLRMMERDGMVIAVEPDRFYAREAVEALVERLRGAMGEGDSREYTPTELREVLGISRRFLIPFLEFCDQKSITERRATGRVLRTR